MITLFVGVFPLTQAVLPLPPPFAPNNWYSIPVECGKDYDYGKDSPKCTDQMVMREGRMTWLIPSYLFVVWLRFMSYYMCSIFNIPMWLLFDSVIFYSFLASFGMRTACGRCGARRKCTLYGRWYNLFYFLKLLLYICIRICILWQFWQNRMNMNRVNFLTVNCYNYQYQSVSALPTKGMNLEFHLPFI